MEIGSSSCQIGSQRRKTLVRQKLPVVPLMMRRGRNLIGMFVIVVRLSFKMFFIQKYIVIIFFYFYKIIF